jgi:hypothetical protein
LTLLAVDQDIAVGRVLEPRDHPHRRGLAAARGAEQHQELAIGDRQVEIVDADEAAPALAHIAQLDFGQTFPPWTRCPRIFCIRLQKA